MFTLLHSSTSQELFKKYNCDQSSHYETYRWYRAHQLLSETEVSIAHLCWLCSIRYTAVQIKNCLKSISVIKVTIVISTDDFRYAKRPSHGTTKSAFFTVCKDEWNTNVTSMKNILYILQYAKLHQSG